MPVVELGDEFSYGDIPDPKMWDRYDSVGNGGNGLRRPDQITVQDGHLQIAGLSDGTSGGMMSSTVEPRYGRWETRMRVDKKGQGGAYHPVISAELRPDLSCQRASGSPSGRIVARPCWTSCRRRCRRTIRQSAGGRLAR